MNWYRLSALDPNAWNWHSKTHRLPSDRNVINTPYGRIIQKVRNNDELQKDYAGVHTTHDINLAAIYANNLSSEKDPPVIIEISTTKAWYPDIDAINSTAVDAEILKEMLSSLDIKNRILKSNNISETIKDIMQDISDLDNVFDDYSGDSVDSVPELIINQSQRNNPSSIVDFFNHYYGSYKIKAFYNNFIMPLYFNSGEIDKNLSSWIVNQMRFLDPIPESEVIGIHTFRPFNEEFNINEEYEEDGYEEDKTYQKDKLDYGDVIYGLDIKTVWKSNYEPLINDVFDTVFHGTTLSRAKQAFPYLRSLDLVKRYY
ncbi:MAG: hypothetical protein WDA06_05605 [Phenylobacterium sp.]